MLTAILLAAILLFLSLIIFDLNFEFEKAKEKVWILLFICDIYQWSWYLHKSEVERRYHHYTITNTGRGCPFSAEQQLTSWSVFTTATPARSRVWLSGFGEVCSTGDCSQTSHMRNPNKSPDHWALLSVLVKNSGKCKMSICGVLCLLSPKLFKLRIWCWVVPKYLLLSNVGRGRHLSFHRRTLRLDHSRKSKVAWIVQRWLWAKIVLGVHATLPQTHFMAQKRKQPVQTLWAISGCFKNVTSCNLKSETSSFLAYSFETL